MIFKIGEARFGAPDASIRTGIEAIDDVDRLERIGDRILVASDWNDMIKTTADSKSQASPILHSPSRRTDFTLARS